MGGSVESQPRLGGAVWVRGSFCGLSVSVGGGDVTNNQEFSKVPERCLMRDGDGFWGGVCSLGGSNLVSYSSFIFIS